MKRLPPSEKQLENNNRIFTPNQPTAKSTRFGTRPEASKAPVRKAAGPMPESVDTEEERKRVAALLAKARRERVVLPGFDRNDTRNQYYPKPNWYKQ